MKAFPYLVVFMYVFEKLLPYTNVLVGRWLSVRTKHTCEFKSENEI